MPITATREDSAFAKRITNADDLRAAVSHYCELLPYSHIVATAQHLSTDIDYDVYTDEDINAALSNRAHAHQVEQNAYASSILNIFLDELERRNERIVFQFSLGAEPLPFESGCRIRQETLRQIASLIARYPRLRFMCFNASRHVHQTLCTFVRELPNFSLGGYWWHGFFPGALRQVIEERLDMVPLNKQCGFLTDAYCVDWVYGKTLLLLQAYADVFAHKMVSRQYAFGDIEEIVRWIFLESPRRLLGI